MSKTFASAADLDEKKIGFDKLSEHACAYTAEGAPNTGVIISDDTVMVIDTQATPKGTRLRGPRQTKFCSVATWSNLTRPCMRAPEKLVPGRGAALQTHKQVRPRLESTRDFIRNLFASMATGAKAGKDRRSVYEETFAKLKPKYGNWVIFNHCMPFDVTRACDEATEYPDPRIWTAERNRQMWIALEG